MLKKAYIINALFIFYPESCVTHKSEGRALLKLISFTTTCTQIQAPAPTVYGVCINSLLDFTWLATEM